LLFELPNERREGTTEFAVQDAPEYAVQKLACTCLGQKQIVHHGSFRSAIADDDHRMITKKRPQQSHKLRIKRLNLGSEIFVCVVFHRAMQEN